MLVHMFQRLIKFLSEYAIRWDTILLLKHLPASSNTEISMDVCFNLDVEGPVKKHNFPRNYSSTGNKEI